MRDHARQKADKLARVSTMIMRVNVILTMEAERQMAEVSATVRHRGELVAKAETRDMYASIDQAMIRIEKQIHKLEERIKDKRESGRDKWAGTRLVEEEAEAESDDDIEEPE
jgi:putative sigma-54 modulation protein